MTVVVCSQLSTMAVNTHTRTHSYTIFIFIVTFLGVLNNTPIRVDTSEAAESDNLY